MRKKGLTTSKVQTLFNRAIIERDRACMVRNGDRCSGQLQCSHFYPVGGNSGLRYYPYNAYAQCAGHHLAHHNRDPKFYAEWMMKNHPEELEWMESVRGKAVRYSQYVLTDIYAHLCADDLEGVRMIVRGLFK